MAEVNNCGDPTFPSKRLPDQLSPSPSPFDLKKPKLDDPTTNGNHQNDAVLIQQQPPKDEKIPQKQEHEQEHEEEDTTIPQPVIDRKGKGILIEDQNDDSEDGDDDDSDDDSGSDSNSGGDEGSDDSDFIDDPLAEVDMDNILPCRTRRKVINPASFTHLPDDDDDDDSDDPDA